jgi:acetyl/propionyl-CoA carboxylase alpha subunit
VSGSDRRASIARALVAVAEYEVEGIRTNLDLLTFVLKSDQFQVGRYHTGLLTELGDLPIPERSDEEEALARILAVLELDQGRLSATTASPSENDGVGVDPWFHAKLQSQLRSWSS